MNNPVTVAASVPFALGGFIDEDPPVLVGLPGMPKLSSAWVAWHPRTQRAKSADELLDGLLGHEDDVLLLPQSTAALVRVLARHLDMELGPAEVPRHLWSPKLGLFQIRTKTSEMHIYAGPLGRLESDPEMRSVPTLGSTIAILSALSDMAALAIILLHFAELETGIAEPPRTHCVTCHTHERTSCGDPDCPCFSGMCEDW